jgi:hypothetical protein
MFRLSRMALFLLITSILSTTALLAAPGPGAAQPRRSVISASAPPDVVSQFWSFLTRIWSKNGSEVDPNGVRTKNGSQMDPDGRTMPTSAPVTPNRDNGH